jgi:hypothetical protein
MADVPRRSEARLPGARVSIAGPNTNRPSADPTRSHQTTAVSRSELHRRLARLPARVRLLLQRGVLRRRRSFYTQTVDAALAEIERLPGRHLYFLDDHLFGDRRFASALFDGMRGMGRLWQAAGTVSAVLAPDLLERAVDAGLRSLFVGFETLNPANLAEQRKYQNMRRDYAAAVRRLHDLGVMINGSFVFGMDGDDASVFERTVEWAIEQGIETATFHILTPYPATTLYRRISDQGRLTVRDWDLYDTRHAVFRPARMSADQLECGYRWAYREFYRWRSIVSGASAHEDLMAGLRHLAYSAGWKKFEPLWDIVIRAKRAGTLLPVLETILSEFGRRSPGSVTRDDLPAARTEDQGSGAVETPRAQLVQIETGGVGEIKRCSTRTATAATKGSP